MEAKQFYELYKGEECKLIKDPPSRQYNKAYIAGYRYDYLIIGFDTGAGHLGVDIENEYIHQDKGYCSYWNMHPSNVTLVGERSSHKVIDIPDGYELDYDRTSSTTIVLKHKDTNLINDPLRRDIEDTLRDLSNQLFNDSFKLGISRRLTPKGREDLRNRSLYILGAKVEVLDEGDYSIIAFHKNELRRITKESTK